MAAPCALQALGLRSPPGNARRVASLQRDQLETRSNPVNRSHRRQGQLQRRLVGLVSDRPTTRLLACANQAQTRPAWTEEPLRTALSGRSPGRGSASPSGSAVILAAYAAVALEG